MLKDKIEMVEALGEVEEEQREQIKRAVEQEQREEKRQKKADAEARVDNEDGKRKASDAGLPSPGEAAGTSKH